MEERSMELFLVLFTILLFVFLNSLTYILGALATPAGSVFLGTVHWTGDYFYYISQFAQGVQQWFSSYDLYTADFRNPVLVGWVNVFLGRLFYLIGVNHLLAYQLSIVIFAATFLGVSYLLIREIFPDRHSYYDPGSYTYKKRMVAFVLFVTSNAFPKIVFEGGRWGLSYFDFWFNTGLPFNRLGGVPHHLIARTAVSLALLLGIWWWKSTENREQRTENRESWVIIFGLSIIGFVLASVEPVHWTLVVAVLFLMPIFYFIVIPFIKYLLYKIKNAQGAPESKIKIADQNLKLLTKKYLLPTTYYFLPSILLFLGGLPMAVYLKNIFSYPPYSQLSIWENTQQLHINFLDFILGNGPVMVLAIFGFFLMFKKINPARIIALVFTVVIIFLYFSPIPQIVKIVNVRFLPANTTIFLAIFATEFVFLVASKFKKREKWAVISIIFIIVIITIPATVKQLQIRTTVDPKNAFFYVSKDVISVYREAQKLSSISDTFLVIWPFNWSFPGITGRRVYEGHNLLTVDYHRKEKLASSFFFEDMKKGEMQELLLSEKIDYVLTYPWTRNINDIPVLEKIYENKTLGIYRVNKLKTPKGHPN